MDSKEIRSKRKGLGLTQKEFATLVGVSGNTIINWERGENIPASKYPILDLVLNNARNDKNQSLPSVNYFKDAKEKYIKESKGVPYYDVDFTSSFLEVENNQSVAPNSYISHPFFSGCDFVVRNSGQSMAKVICHGDAVGLVRLLNWKEFFPFGEVYAIVTNDNLRMIKIITKGEDNEHYSLISKPTDSKKDEFPPQQIMIKSILFIFRVQASSHLF